MGYLRGREFSGMVSTLSNRVVVPGRVKQNVFTKVPEVGCPVILFQEIVSSARGVGATTCAKLRLARWRWRSTYDTHCCATALPLEREPQVTIFQ